MELWSRARNGQSVLLRVHGVRPWFEITPHGKWKDDETHPNLPETHEEITEVRGPELKWTYLGEKPVWKVFVKQPFMVPKIREELSGKWTILSGDIPFVNRFFLDGDLSMHVTILKSSNNAGNFVVFNMPASIFSVRTFLWMCLQK